MKQFFGTILNVLIWVLAIVLGFLVVSGLYQRFVNDEGYTGLFGIGYAVVVSGSMEPNVHIDDLIIYQEQDKEDLQVDQIIVYEKNNADGKMLITHRIESLKEDMLVTKGDANTLSDQPISYDAVIGKVVWRIPGVGKAISFIKSPAGLFAAGIVVVLILIGNLLLMLNNRKRLSNE